jgi:hypothetical protein
VDGKVTVVYYRLVDECEDSYYKLETLWDVTSQQDYIAGDSAENYFKYYDGIEHTEAGDSLLISLHTAKTEESEIGMLICSVSLATLVLVYYLSL